METPFFDIDKPGMQATVNKFKPGNGFVWPKLFPLKFTRKFTLEGIEGDDGIPVAADRVAFNTKAPKKTRKTIGKWNGKLGKYAVSREKDEIDINDYRDAQTLANASDANPEEKRELIRIVYDDVSFCRTAMDAKVEIDAMGVATSGKQQFKPEIDGEMATADEINFNVPEGNFIGYGFADKKDKKGTALVVGADWGDSENADGLRDLKNAQEMIAKKGIPKPRYAFMEKNKFQQLMAQRATVRRLFPQVTDLSVVSAEMITLEKINAYNAKAEHGYPHIIVLDTYVSIEHKDGARDTIKPWAENVVVLAPSTQLGWTYYKPVPMLENTPALQVAGPFYTVTRYSEPNPKLEVTLAEAYVQPALINRQSLVFFNTEAKDWNGGAVAE